MATHGNTHFIDLSDHEPGRPIVLAHLRGTYDRPVIVTCGPTISVNTFGRDPAEAANRIARLRQENGFYPSVGQIGDQAALALIDCQFVVVRGLTFDQCWPAALDLNNCQNITVLDCSFGPSTVAIGANGNDTRDIWVERCTFAQTGHRDLWDKIEWRQVHGSYENSKLGVAEDDHRHFDGDFFRAWDVAGNVTIRDCDISDAFNGIHFFNSVDDLPADADRTMANFNNGRRAASNVVIENNRFARIRDNCVEPEEHAWNWVVRSNVFDDCYAPYSFELERGGWFYIYDNHHWLLEPATIGGRKGGSGFKLGKEHRNEGDFYIFNNSWLFANGERLFRKGVLGRMKHFNNAIRLTQGTRRLFGSGWEDAGGTTTDPWDEESRRFTRRWKHFGIEMNGDWIHEPGGPDWRDYREAGYPLGDGTSNRHPGFERPTRRKKGGKEQLWLKPSREMRESGVGWTMRLPAHAEALKGGEDFGKKYEITVPAGCGVGAGMRKKQLKFFRKALRFAPDFPVSPDSIGRKKGS